jgi:hypothetical protein
MDEPALDTKTRTSPGQDASSGAPYSASPQADRREALRPSMSTWDQAFTQLQQRVATLIESIEGQTRRAEAPPSAGPDVSPDVVDDPLDRAADALDAGHEAERAELPLLIDRLAARAEPPTNLSGIVASLPEITAEQRQALSRVDHRLDLMKVRIDATADALAGIVREIEHLQRKVDELGETTGASRQTESELAANQREMAESLNLLHDLVARCTETIKSNAAWVEMLAEAPDQRFAALREQVTTATARVEVKSSITLVAGGLAALASIAALVLSLKR